MCQNKNNFNFFCIFILSQSDIFQTVFLFPVSLHTAVYVPLCLLHGVRPTQETGKKQTIIYCRTYDNATISLFLPNPPRNSLPTEFILSLGPLILIVSLIIFVFLSGVESELYLKYICLSLQFEYQQAQLEAEIENLSWKVERADSYERGVVGGEGELSASDRGVREDNLWL